MAKDPDTTAGMELKVAKGTTFKVCTWIDPVTGKNISKPARSCAVRTETADNAGAACTAPGATSSSCPLTLTASGALRCAEGD